MNCSIFNLIDNDEFQTKFTMVDKKNLTIEFYHTKTKNFQIWNSVKT